MKRLLKYFAMAAVLSVAATLFIVAPAGAVRLSTSVESTSALRRCPSDACDSAGNAPAGSAARSYCRVGTFDLVFVDGINRFGFITRTALFDETQTTGCFDGGSETSVAGDVDLRACANTACLVISDLAFGDVVRQYCQRTGTDGNLWICVFNENGQMVGFVQASELNDPPIPTSC